MPARTAHLQVTVHHVAAVQVHDALHQLHETAARLLLAVRPALQHRLQQLAARHQLRDQVHLRHACEPMLRSRPCLACMRAEAVANVVPRVRASRGCGQCRPSRARHASPCSPLVRVPSSAGPGACSPPAVCRPSSHTAQRTRSPPCCPPQSTPSGTPRSRDAGRRQCRSP
jgi:hypothetical protein